MNPSTNPTFRTSSYSDRNDCVEVADLPGSSVVRDSQNPGLGRLEVPAAAWSALVTTVRAAERHGVQARPKEPDPASRTPNRTSGSPRCACRTRTPTARPGLRASPDN
ncbi:DUF397 domain-containing protein [Nocardiopsis sp. NPDC050513]|uniref:DUF397 domain-containing protein n=1 Tax=Nocardiopsis sp. NPDC050513 TaxID=3364338 RepID=UPI00378BF8D5